MFNSKKEIEKLNSSLLNQALHNLNNINRPSTIKKYDWLLSDWDSKTWKLTNWNGDKKNPIFLHWRQLLPNGLFLTDKRYQFILERTKLVIAAMRTGPNATISRSNLQTQTSIYLFALIRWMVLIGYDDEPYQLLSFESLSESDFERFKELIPQGLPGLEMHLERCEQFLINLSHKELNELKNKDGTINRKKLGKAINIKPQRLFKARIDLLLEKFEDQGINSEYKCSKKT